MVKRWPVAVVIGLALMVMFGLALAQLNVPGTAAWEEFGVMEDPSRQMTLAQAAAAEDNYELRREPALVLGITQRVYWVALDISRFQGTFTPAYLQLKNGNIDVLDIYVPLERDAGGAVSYRHYAGGNKRPTAWREVLHPTWIVSLPADRTLGPVYVRLESTAALRMPVWLWDREALWRDVVWHYIGFGLFYGILGAAALFHLFGFFLLRDRAYLWYSLYVVLMLWYQLQVQGHWRLLYQGEYGLTNAVFWLSVAACFIVSTLFAREFLQIHDRSPAAACLAGLAGLALLQGVLGALEYNVIANQLAHGLALGGSAWFLGLGIWRWRQGFRAARYYALAWSLMFCGIAAWATAAYVWLPLPLVYFILPASVGEVVFLALALADRLGLLRRQQQQLVSQMAHYRDLSLMDALTGVYNKRQLQERLTACVAAGRKRPMALLVIDIDFFKQYNDTYGHWEGDRVLARLGQLLQQLTQAQGEAFRYGGEEFVVLLAGASRKEALLWAERLRLRFANEGFTPSGSQGPVSATLSVGVALLQAGDSVASWFQRADRALYAAKQQGRNRSVAEA